MIPHRRQQKLRHHSGRKGILGKRNSRCKGAEAGGQSGRMRMVQRQLGNMLHPHGTTLAWDSGSHCGV